MVFALEMLLLTMSQHIFVYKKGDLSWILWGFILNKEKMAMDAKGSIF